MSFHSAVYLRLACSSTCGDAMAAIFSKFPKSADASEETGWWDRMRIIDMVISDVIVMELEKF